MSSTYVRFISIAGHLQRQRPGQPIKLPVARLAQELGVTPQMVSLYRKFAQDEGLLKLVHEHDQAARRATEFTFALELFDLNTGAQKIIMLGTSSTQ
jgi:hypothetical protein